MTDIVDRLRALNADFLHEEAADEIERLRERVAAARREGIEAAAKVAERVHMVEPDGGSPSDAEYEVAKTAAQRIRALLENGR